VTSAEGATAVLLDIEGSTTPISFVHEVLFPFAGAHVKGFFDAHGGSSEVAEIADALYEEYRTDLNQKLNPPRWDSIDDLDAAAAYVRWLIGRDRKSTPLKMLQGQIWQLGYQSGELKGEVFNDVPEALERWHRRGHRVAIFSSGSALAQKLLFANSTAGDLTPFIGAYFDTTLGPKMETDSYRRIAAAIGIAAPSIVFVSDVTKELAAARAAGLEALLSMRPGNHPQDDADEYPQIRSLLEMSWL
jgi:enolase-phosphatase E1